MEIVGTTRDLRITRAPGVRTLTDPVLKLDLADEIATLHDEQGWETTGRNAKTLVKHRDLRIVLIVMKQGNQMNEHSTSGAVSIHALTGRLRLRVGDPLNPEDRARDQEIDVPAGSLLALEGDVSHDVEALEDSAFLLSVGTE